MQDVVACAPARNMAVLGLAETALSFAAIYALTTLAGTSAPRFGPIHLTPDDSLLSAAILTLVTGATALAIGLYRAEIRRDRRHFIATSALVGCIAFTILLAFACDRNGGISAAGAGFIATALGTWLATMMLIRLIHRRAMRRQPSVRRILMVGEADRIDAFKVRLRSREGRNFAPVLLDQPAVSWNWLRAHRIWGIVVASDPEARAVEPLLDCKLRGARILSAAAFHETYLGRIDLDLLTSGDLLVSRGFVGLRSGAALKRLSDIVLATVMLMLLLPLMALTALAIRIDSPGPVIYRQQRVGLFDRRFTVFKFRSMVADAEAGIPRWAQLRDPRVTGVGRCIRATRIDELPQLLNVILGDMSLVGPRPERPHFVEQLSRAIPFYRQRSNVKPGLTGWAQVRFPYGASVEDAREKLAYDLYYAKNRSFLLDLLILVSTVRVVLSGDGAR
jgi:sugar transferase (PEP-CTERM system associated)